jgi:hypothetical protein
MGVGNNSQNILLLEWQRDGLILRILLGKRFFILFIFFSLLSCFLHSHNSSQFLPFSSSSKQHQKLLLRRQIMSTAKIFLSIPNWGEGFVMLNKTALLGKRRPSVPVQENDPYTPRSSTEITYNVLRVWNIFGGVL